MTKQKIVSYERAPPNVVFKTAVFDGPFSVFDQEDLGNYNLIVTRDVLHIYQNPEAFLSQSYNRLVPGKGFIEIQCFGAITADNGALDGTAIMEVQKLLCQACGQEEPQETLSTLPRVLAAVGFTDINMYTVNYPVHPKAICPGMPEDALDESNKTKRNVAKMIQLMVGENNLPGVVGRKAFRKLLAMKPWDSNHLLQRCRAELLDRKSKAYFPAYVNGSPSFLSPFFFPSSFSPFQEVEK